MWLTFALLFQCTTVSGYAAGLQALTNRSGWNATTSSRPSFVAPSTASGSLTITASQSSVPSSGTFNVPIVALSSSQVHGCGPCTINVRDASVDYIFPSADSTSTGPIVNIELTTGDEIPHTITPPDAVPSAGSKVAYDPLAQRQTEADQNDLSSHVVDDSLPASVPVTAQSVTITSMASTTTLVAFTAYEIERIQRLDVSGTTACVTTTRTMSIDNTYSFNYSGDPLDTASDGTGDVPQGFLDYIHEPACAAGKWYGDATVLVVVGMNYASVNLNGAEVGVIESTVPPFWQYPSIILESRLPPKTPAPKQTVQQTKSGQPIAGDAVPTGILQQVGSVLSPSAAGGVVPPILTLGSHTVTGNAATQYYFGSGTILTPGGTVAVDGTTVVLDASANHLIIGGSSLYLSPVPIQTPMLNVDGKQYPLQSGNTIVIEGQTLVAGSRITVAGTIISLGPSASYAVINGATAMRPLSASTTAPPILPINGAKFTVGPGSGTSYGIGGQYLTPGGEITVADLTISLSPSATALVINGVTTTLSSPGSEITNAPLLTLGGQTITANARTAYTVDGQALTPGGAIVIDGTSISLAPGATALIVDGRTTTLFPATTLPSGSAESSPTTPAASFTEQIVKPIHTKAGDALAVTVSRTVLSLLVVASLFIVF